MTDEDVVRIAQGLSEDGWKALGFNVDQYGDWSYSIYAYIDRPYVKKGLLERVADDDDYDEGVVRLTDLGKRVWAWSPVFYDRGTK